MASNFRVKAQASGPKRGARVEMNKKNLSVQLPQKCAVCDGKLERSQWLRCNSCSNINLCVSCAISESHRHKCLDEHTFTVMFRIHELSLHNSTKHDDKLDNVMKGGPSHTCDNCHLSLNLTSWVRCNDCSDFDLCMMCWASSYNDHCLNVRGSHTFTNMSHRYRTKSAPTCSMLTEKELTLNLFERVGINSRELTPNPLYDRSYCTPACTEANSSNMHTMWSGNWAGANTKLVGYYCPSGWRRFSLKTANIDFDNSVTVYHGTCTGTIAKIFKNGLLSRECQHGFSAAYVSPSIVYCAHPRYARVAKMSIDGKVVYAQFVAELRVNLNALKTWRIRETLRVGSAETIDPNFPQNEGLELLLCKEPSGSFVTPEDGVHITGVMVRALDHDPLKAAESWWWTKWKSARFLRKRYYVYEPGLEEPEDHYYDNENGRSSPLHWDD